MKTQLLSAAMLGVLCASCIEEGLTEGSMTLQISDVTRNSAQLSGEIQLSGKADDGAISQKGFAWGKTATLVNAWNPDYYYDSYYYDSGDDVGYFESGVSGTGSFEHVAANLSSSATYYVKTFAVVNGKAVFGEVKSFTTKEAEPYVTVGSLDVQSTDLGSTSWSSAEELCESSTVAGYTNWRLPTVGELATMYQNRVTIGGFKSDYSGSYYWSSSIQPQSSSSYYVLDFYDGEQTYTSSGSANNVRCVRATTVKAKPTVLTLDASNLTASSATLNGCIASSGEPAYTERGFAYGTMHNPTTDNGKIVSYASRSDSVYSEELTGLTMSTPYYVRAYAVNSEGTAYGDEVSFALTAQLPTITTLPATNMVAAFASVTLHGNITSAGIDAYTERGFCYSNIFQTPTVDEDKKVVSGSGTTGKYLANLTGLTLDKTYYVRAYATNSQGTAYGEVQTFTIARRLASLATNAVSNLTETSVTLNATITDAGDPAYTERGFAYSATFINPTVDNDKEDVSGTDTGKFSANVSGLSTGTTYHVRAYATNEKGTAYGQSISFTPSSSEYVTLTVEKIVVQKTDITSNAVNWTNANNLCENSTLGGYTDWRLPTSDELTMMFNKKSEIGGFATTNSYYWSSTFNSSSFYYYLNMVTGVRNYQYYTNTSRARCVRTLP